MVLYDDVLGAMKLIATGSVPSSALISIICTHNLNLFHRGSICSSILRCKQQRVVYYCDRLYSSSDKVSNEELVKRMRSQLHEDNNEDGSNHTQDFRASAWDKLWQESTTPWDLGKPTPVLTSELDLYWNTRSFVKLDTSHSKRELTSLIPGCGAGYDLITLALHHQQWITTLRNNSTNAPTSATVVGLDISETSLLQRASTVIDSGTKDVTLANTRIDLTYGDFFKRESWTIVRSYGSKSDRSLQQTQETMQFDFIFDYTFFCAIHPTLRKAWGEQMATLLSENGRLLTVIFPIVPSADMMDGPPYPVTLDDYRSVLEPYGVIMDDMTCSNDESKSTTPVRVNPHTVPARVGKELVCWWIKQR